MGDTVLGRMNLRFYRRDEVSLTDTIPDAAGPIHYPLWFAFMFAGKLLYNFPGDSGIRATVDGANRLSGLLDSNDPFARNSSLLGVLSGTPLKVVAERRDNAKEYRGELIWKRDNLIVTTKIASGEEDYYHRAAIDAALERVRVRLGRDGGILGALALIYFRDLAQRGTSNLTANLSQAGTAATLGAQQISARQAQAGSA
jgi:hypothetical protein